MSTDWLSIGASLPMAKGTVLGRLLAGDPIGSATGGVGSASAGRVSDLIAGKPTLKLNHRIADVRDRQWSTQTGRQVAGNNRRGAVLASRRQGFGADASRGVLQRAELS